MGAPKIGDKLFLYGHFLRFLPEFEDYEYNALMGYMTIGGFVAQLVETDNPVASVSGFVVDFCVDSCLAAKTPFPYEEMLEVTQELSKQSPLPEGTKVWAPTTGIPRMSF